jgi:hypothetical protein
MAKPYWLRIRTKGRFRARIEVYRRVKKFPYFKVEHLKSKLVDSFEQAAEVAGTLSRQHRQLAEIWQGRTFVCNVNGMAKDFKARLPSPIAKRSIKDTPSLYTLDDETAMIADIRTAMACSLFGEAYVDTSNLELDPDYVDLVEDPVCTGIDGRR